MSNFTNRQAVFQGLAFVFFASYFMLADAAFANSFSVSPVRVNLSADVQIAALRVQNSSNKPIAIQAELMNWSQQDGVDNYTPTSRELLVTPPIFTVPPGETQVIRVGLRRLPDREQELSYRLFLQELPPPIPDNFQGLRMVSRISLPVFIAPVSGETNPELIWKARLDGADNLRIIVNNNGTGHGQISALHLMLPGGQELTNKANSYILPGAELNWQVPIKGKPMTVGSDVTLSADVNGKAHVNELRVE